MPPHHRWHVSARLTRRRVLGGMATSMLAAAVSHAAADTRCLAPLLDRRRMVRRFTDAPIDDATVARLLAAARRAPSAGDTEPWAFVVVRDPARRRALARAALGQAFVATAPVVIVACTDTGRARPRYGERGVRYGWIDVAFASLLLLLAVAEAGLGACFVGAFDDDEVSRLLELPDAVLPVAVIPVGHPAESPRGRERRPSSEVVHRERWRTPPR
jgi:nitroreductase